MKFDKLMEHLYKVLCLTLVILIICGSVVSCIGKPVSASAVDVTDAVSMVKDFRDQYLHNLGVVEDAILTDIQNGNLDASSSVGRQVLDSFAFQSSSRVGEE